MAKINDVQVIEKNTGEKIQWEQDGYRLSFDDDALSVKVTKYQATRPAPSTCAWIVAVISCSAPSPAAAMWPDRDPGRNLYRDTDRTAGRRRRVRRYQPPDRRAHKEPARHGRGEADPLEH